MITGTASGYSWAFGDNSTSTQRITSHTYSTAGSVTVTLTVTFGGTTQSATKTVIVHDLPIADFTLDGSNFCFLNQEVCLTDKSAMGSTTSGTLHEESSGVTEGMKTQRSLCQKERISGY